jgi:nucleoside 2-deoxyribosyltransferase
MKIVIIGSTQYQDKFTILKQKLESEGHEVRIPAFDHHPEFDELQVCEYNRSLIEWSDEVRMIWDRRSTGTIFDFGMTFALRKPFKIEYLEPKTFENVMRKYES